MKRTLIQDFIEGKIVINTKTQEEFNWLMDYLEKETHITWCSRALPSENNDYYKRNKEKTCVMVLDNSITYGSESWLENNTDKKIVNCKDVVIELERSKLNNVPNFEDLTKEMFDTYKLKNEKYGDSFGKSIYKYGMIAALTRISDKFNRFEQLILNDDNGTDDERLEDTLLDMANYCIMTVIELKNKSAEFGNDKEK